MVGIKTVLKRNLKIEELEKENRKLKQEIAFKNQLFSISSDYIFLLGLDGKIVEVSHSVRELLNLENEIIPSKLSKLNLIHIKDLHKFIKSTKSILNGKTIKPFNSIFLTPKKESRHVHVQISPIKSDGEITAILIYATDVTDHFLLEKSINQSSSLNKALKDKEMLVREIHHRTKNNLMIMASLFSLASSEIEDEDAKAIFNQTHSRVKSMTLIHEKLYQSDDLKYINFGDYIRNLAQELFNSFLNEPDKMKLIMELEDLKINIETAIPVGLILNELLTNSIEYAFPNGEYGTIFINFYKNTDHYVLIVADDGVGLPSDLDIDKSNTLGFQLIKNLTGQIEGDMIVNRDKGTEITICFNEYNPEN